MNTKSSTVCVVLACLLLVWVGLSAAPPARAAGEDWTCSGVKSAVCIATLTAERCVVRDQTCFPDDRLFRAKDCACAPVCDRSADCGTSEACYKNHCWSTLACNSINDCPADATCFEGTCRKLGSCTAANVDTDCNSAAPDCIDGTCGTLLPGQCNIDADCGGDPCAGPARCDARAHRCVRQGPPPCVGIARARCFAASATDFQCYVPACTSDAQCAVNACEGAQHCDRPTGRCVPVQPACNEAAGEFCQALSLTQHQCLLTAPQPPWGHIDNSPAITQPDLTLIPVVGSPSGAGAGRFVLTGLLPASAIGKGRPRRSPSFLRVRTERYWSTPTWARRASRVLGGSMPSPARGAGTRGQGLGHRTRAHSVVRRESGGLRLRSRAGPARRLVTSMAPRFGCRWWPDAKPVRSTIAFTDCKAMERMGAMTTRCTGKASPVDPRRGDPG